MSGIDLPDGTTIRKGASDAIIDRVKNGWCHSKRS